MAYTRANPLDLTSAGDNIDEGFDKVDKDLDDIFTNLNAHDHSTGKGGTLVASTISDFDTAVASNSAVAANTAKVTCNSTTVNTAGAVMNTDTTTASMQFVVDEDNMLSDSDTKVPTQQSVKAYAMGVEDYELSLGRIMNPLLHLPLKNSLDMICGTGSVTFTRASNATYIDRYGVVQKVGNDVPRFEKEGLLIEGASTNKCLQSEDFSTNWSAQYSTVSTNTTIAPDRTTTADTLIPSTDNNCYHQVYQNSITSAGTYTFSCFAKASGYNYVTLNFWNATDGDVLLVGFDLSTSTITSGGVYTSAKITKLSNGWYRCKGTATVTDSSQVNIRCGNKNSNFAGDGSSGICIWGAQLEEMPFATSYIPTTTAAATRAKDICYLIFSGNCPLMGVDPVTFLCDANVVGGKDSFNQYVFNISDGSSCHTEIFNNNIHTYFKYAGAYILALSHPMSSTIERLGIVFDGTTAQSFKDGLGYNSTTNVATQSNTDIYIYLGSTSTQCFQPYGHISNFRIYDVALSSQEMRIA